jgi:hypothetical protein
MSRKIKIGLDKTPAPVTKQFQQLVDIEGTLLFDDAGNPLVTEESAALTSLTLSQNSLSVHVNNDGSQPAEVGGGAIPIVEQFKEVSEVSSSLLGVARAEEQLSLFSDVATYGLDIDNWDASDIYSSHRNDPPEWYTKKHPVFGRRSNVKFYEGSDQQALYLKAFPSQWSFPYGTVFEKRSEPTAKFKRYMRFIALGIHLYRLFSAQGPDGRRFAKNNFLRIEDVRIVNQFGDALTLGAYDLIINDGPLQFRMEVMADGFFDVEYVNDDIQGVFDSIERWTAFWDKIRSATDSYPTMTNFSNENTFQVQENGYKGFREYNKIVDMIQTKEALPGKDTDENYTGDEYYGILQSKRTFRYQPGRASGFTFGSRMIAGGQGAIAEWGCSNDTDEYMFQLQGERLSLVRRSTIKMPDELLQRQGISPLKQTKSYMPGIKSEETREIWETIIERTDFTGDPLDGTGDTRYALSFEDVTMYKIEFSWYGAIGAKFYAYIPVGNGDCRWVLMHTFVIENGLGQPVLENPDFRFKYLLYTNFTEDIKQPIYLYKFGSSCYIDGGDEGTIRLNSESSPQKPFQSRTSMIGIMPKEVLKNSKGVPKLNFKKIYPSSLSVSSDTAAKLTFEEIAGTSQGVHFHYSPSIHMDGVHPKNRTVALSYRLDESDSSVANGVNMVSATNSRQLIQFDDYQGNPITPTALKFGVTATNGSDSITHPQSSTAGFGNNYKGLQVGDSLSIGGNEYVIKSFKNGSTVVYVSSSDTDGLVLETPFSGVTNSYEATLVYRFQPSDHMAHIIADGVYGSYVDTLENLGDLYGRGDDPDYSKPEYSIIPRTATNSEKVDESVFSYTQLAGTAPESFLARLNSYRTVVASKTPVYANKFKIHFLNPQIKDKGLDYDVSGNDSDLWYKHFGEFSVGVTPYLPTETGDATNRPANKVDDHEVLFKVGASSSYDCVEYDRTRFPSIEYSHATRDYDQNKKLEIKENDTLYGNRLQIDPRLDRRENRIQGSDRGIASTVSCEVTVNDYRYDSVTGPVIVDGRQVSVVKFSSDPSNSPPPAGVIEPGISEVGFQFVGRSLVYRSDLIEYAAEDQEVLNQGSDAEVRIVAAILIDYDPTFQSQIANMTPENRNIQSKTITITDDWKPFAVDSSGRRLFDDQRFTVSRAVSFNDAQPLYPVFALGDYAHVNGVVVEEILEQGVVRTHTPEFVIESSSLNPNVSIANSGGSNSLNSSSAFNDNADMASSRYDITNSNPLRPGVELYSCYVGENETVTVDLENIFSRDRKGITRGSLNNRAVYLTASSLDGSIGSMQLSVTSKEQ